VIQKGTDIRAGQTVTSEVCVIGGGAAGITLALELARRHIQVTVVEAGGLGAADPGSGDLEGELLDPGTHAPLEEVRGRQLGGTTSLWVGRCVPFDPIDFERREYLEDSGWPVSFEEIARYYPQANEYCHAGACAYTREDALPEAQPSLVPGCIDAAITANHLERWSLPTRFGSHYRRALAKSQEVRVLLHSVCTGIDLDSRRRTVTGITVSTSPGRTFRVEAQTFILAGGGLETTRLLLAASQGEPEGIGNRYGHLGRYYMGHLFGSVAEIAFTGDPRKTVYGFERDARGVYCRRRFWVTPEVQKREGILNTALWLDNPAPAEPLHRNGILSAAYLAMSIPVLRDWLAPAAIRKAFRGQPVPRSFWPHVRNIIADLPAASVYLSGFLVRHYLARRRLPGLQLFSPSNRYSLFYHAEQAPSPDSRIMLGERCDRFGVPRLRVDFRYSQQDIDSVYRAHQVLAAEVTRQGCASVQFKQEDVHAHIRQQVADGFHQLGTTRMSVDERSGVVDPNCRLHGIHNLYVCSSSVFPTSGQANPTLTIVALAIRLADHIARARDRSQVTLDTIGPIR
jgi:choline dehydrogenase-like flavoprotein